VLFLVSGVPLAFLGILFQVIVIDDLKNFFVRIKSVRKAEGFSERLINEVKKSLGVVFVRECKTDTWRWRLPPDLDDFSHCQNTIFAI